jgi:hypothetical protein
MSHPSRRTFLKTSAAGVGVAGLLSGAKALRAFSGEVASERLSPFPLGSVRLGPGVFREQAEINARYLDSLAVDRLLHSFRLTAGISSTATPYKGWEDPTCELRGHFAGGHFLSAVALASATSGNTVLKERGGELVSGLAQCQKKMATGYLSAYPPALFEKLSQGKEVWAPFYTYHKIMAGLLDMYMLTGNVEALEVCEGMARWTGDYFIGISAEQRQRMLRTEYGGMNEVLVNLAAVTKKDRYLDTAHLFEQPSILDPLEERRDELQGLHANTNVPKIIGAARMYEVTGDRRYRQIAEYFLGEVVAARNYAIGNTSLDEHWTTAPGKLGGTLGWSNAECCVGYNLMKLERLVFGWTGDARWMDEYERTLFNCRLGTQNAQGLKQYFFPLASGYWRAYNSADESFWCCTGTGAEEFAKFADTIFFHRGEDVYVNQFIASTLDWKEQGFTIEQATQFPHEQGTTLKVKSTRPVARTIHVRIPNWTTHAAAIEINGQMLDAMADPGAYLAIRRIWQDGDTIKVRFPMELRQELLAGDDLNAAVLYGPLVLAANLGPGPTDGSARIVHGRGTAPEKLPAPDPTPTAATDTGGKAASWVEVESAANLQFAAAGQQTKYALMPMCEIVDQRYSVYWRTQGGKRLAS